jgi:hypothetical protein
MADTRWYHLEVIVFEQNAPNTEAFEQTLSELDLPANPAYLSRSQQSMSSLLDSPIAYAQVKADDRLLNETYNKLKRSADYRPLLHASWIQPAQSNQVNRGILLNVTDNYGIEIVKGILKIQRGHYLHLIMDMEYAPGQFSSTQNAEFSEPVIYHLKEKRRVRLNEIHYLDHPKFGIILIIKPLQG